MVRLAQLVRPLAALLLVLGIVLLPLRAVAATIPMLIAYDAAVRSTATTALGRQDAVRPETEHARLTAYDDPNFGYDGPRRARLARGAGAVHVYGRALELLERREAVEGVVYDAPAATTAAEGVESAAASSFTRLESLSGNASSKLVDELATSMKASGWQGAPIKVFENDGVRYVLDGTHRLAAALRAGIDVPFETVGADQLGQYGYNSVEDVLNAASETVPNRLR